MNIRYRPLSLRGSLQLEKIPKYFLWLINLSTVAILLVVSLIVLPLLHAANGTYNWTRTLPNSTSEYNISYQSTAASIDGRTIAVINGSGVYVSRDYGETWPISSIPTHPNGSSLDFGATYGLSVSGDGGKMAFATVNIENTATLVYVSTDFGATWSSDVVTDGVNIMGASINDFTMSSDGNVLVAAGRDNDTSSPQTFISRDGGATWSLASNLVDSYGDVIDTLSVWNGGSSIAISDSGNVIYVVDGIGTIQKSIDYGVTWTRQTNPEASVPSINANTSITTNLAGSKVYVFAYTYDIATDSVIMGVYSSTDSGATWTLNSAPLNAELITSISASGDASIIYAVGVASSGNGLWQSTDGGVNWEQNTTLEATDSNGGAATNPIIQYIHVSSDAMHVAILSEQYGHYASNDSGSTWDKSIASGSTRYSTVVSSADGAKMAVIGSGGTAVDNQYMNTVYISNDSGLTWTPRTMTYTDINGSVQSVYTLGLVAMSADGETIIATTQDAPAVYVSTDSGATWTQRDAPSWTETDPEGNSYSQQISVSDVAISGGGNRLIVIDSSGKAFVSIDLGSTWAQTAQITWIGDGGIVNQATQISSVAMSDSGQNIAVVSSNSSSSGGGIYVSKDGGASWLHPTVDSNEGIIFYADSVGGGSASLIAMSNGGSHIVFGGSIGAYDGSTGLTTYSYGVFTSTDTGATWNMRLVHTAIEPAIGAAPAVSMTGDGSVLVAAIGGDSGSQNYLFTSTDLGLTWTKQTAAGNRYWGTTAISDDGSRIIASQHQSFGTAISQSGAIFLGSLPDTVAPSTPSITTPPAVVTTPDPTPTSVGSTTTPTVEQETVVPTPELETEPETENSADISGNVGSSPEVKSTQGLVLAILAAILGLIVVAIIVIRVIVRRARK